MIKNMRGDQKINKSKKFEATVVGPEAEKIANALCKGKDVTLKYMKRLSMENQRSYSTGKSTQTKA
jgi:hypothetical protein